MPKCSECGTETELHELDIPICPECIAGRALGSADVQVLAAEFASATEFYRTRMADFEKHERLLSDPEWTEVQTAKESYLNALRRYGDALRRTLK